MVKPKLARDQRLLADDGMSAARAHGQATGVGGGPRLPVKLTDLWIVFSALFSEFLGQCLTFYS